MPQPIDPLQPGFVDPLVGELLDQDQHMALGRTRGRFACRFGSLLRRPRLRGGGGRTHLASPAVAAATAVAGHFATPADLS